jgi:lysophospholipase L1-like esterase
MPKTLVSQKLLLLLFSAMMTVSGLEIGLRAAGGVILWNKERNNQKNFRLRDSYRILCIGESTTFLGGDSSYPSQLEKILNNRLPGKNFKVINKGIPGVNTNYLLENAGQWLDEYQPNLVLIMMGVNDGTDLKPYTQKTFADKSKDFFLNTRTVKLFHWLKAAIKNKNHHNPLPIKTAAKNKTPKTPGEMAIANDFAQAPLLLKKILPTPMLLEANGEFEKAEIIYRKMLHLTDSPTIKIWIYKRLARNLQQQQKYPELLDIIQFIPHSSWIEDWAERFCTIPPMASKMHQILDEKIKEEPNSSTFYAYHAACFAKEGSDPKSREYAEKADQLRLSGYNPTTQLNYLKLIELLRKDGIVTVAVQYPARDADELRKMLQNSPHIDKITFVDNAEVFEKALLTTKYEEIFYDRFAGDFGHCTDQGNYILAENIASSLINQIFHN